MLATPHCFVRQCVHFEGVKQSDGTERTEIAICSAYPNGIPFRISHASHKTADLHLTIAADQKGTDVFKKRKGG